MGVLVQLPKALEPLVVWMKPKLRQASAALPLGELPKYKILAPLFSLIVAVNVQLTAQAACGESHSASTKNKSKIFGKIFPRERVRFPA
jgi:hypothetical protein